MIPSARERGLAARSNATAHDPRGTVFVSSSRGRSSWSGLLRISLVAIPVKAYPAVSSTASAPRFHFLHAGCGQRIGYQKHCPRHGPVPAEAIERGYEYAPGDCWQRRQLSPASELLRCGCYSCLLSFLALQITASPGSSRHFARHSEPLLGWRLFPARSAVKYRVGGVPERQNAPSESPNPNPARR